MNTVTLDSIHLVKDVINFAACGTLTGTLLWLHVWAFGRKCSPVYSMPCYKVWALKLGLATCATGAFVSAVTASTPEWSEVVLNTGYAALAAWTARWAGRTWTPAPERKPARRRRRATVEV